MPSRSIVPCYSARLTEEDDKRGEERICTNGDFAIFKLATENTLPVVISDLEKSGHDSIIIKPSFLF